MARTKRPRVKLVGQDGNAYNLIGLALRAARSAGWTPAEVKRAHEELTSSKSYDELLMKLCERFDVT